LPATLDLVHRCGTAIDTTTRSTMQSTPRQRIAARNSAGALCALIGALAMIALTGAALAAERVGIEAGTGDHDKALATTTSRGFDRHADTA
jgi:hypothetical protein